MMAGLNFVLVDCAPCYCRPEAIDMQVILNNGLHIEYLVWAVQK